MEDFFHFLQEKYGGKFSHFLHKRLIVRNYIVKKNPKKLSEYARLLGSSD